MKTETTFFLAVAAFLIVLFCAGLHFIYDCGYKRGQIDAANGIQKYELRQNVDGTTSWYQKEF